MKNVLTVMRRDLGAYFTSPVGYVFMMAFVTLGFIFYLGLNLPMLAEMRSYFQVLSWLLCIFAPAVTMRVWAEERKENTWEMLLTFPMQAYELVLGKFFAALIFFAITLSATLVVPLMLAALGNPDGGAIFGGYIGALFLGAFFLALGILFSGFFKDQIVAFVLTLLACLLLFFLGFDPVASALDAKMSELGSSLQLGSFLSDVFGFVSHYGAFTRGVVDLADVLYFLAWTVLFLALNVLFIDGRNRPKARSIFATAVFLCLGIGLIFNWIIIDYSLGRFDLTEEKIYTVSKATKAIFADVDTPVQVKLYITPKAKMPAGLKDIEQSITDKLDEIRIATDGKIEYSTVYLEVENMFAKQGADEDDEKEKSDKDVLEERMLDKGVQPFSAATRSVAESSNKLIYSSLGVQYKDREEEIIQPIDMGALMELEYRLVNVVYKQTLDKKPVVALVAPKEAVNIDPQMKAMLMQMGQPIPESDDPYVYLEQILQHEKYDVRRVELTKESPLPEDYDALAVINPRSLNERQRWEINRALYSGKPVVMAVQTYEWDYRPTRNGITVSPREEKPEINPLLEKYGLGVSDEILMDENNVELTIQTGGLQDLFGGGTRVPSPTHILVNNNSMDDEMSITNRLSNVFYLWGTALEMDDDKLAELGLTADVLMNTSDKAWTVENPDALTRAGLDAPANKSDMKAYPLLAMVQGQFPDAFKDKDRPAWPKPEPQPGQPPMPDDDEVEPPAAPVDAAPGKLVLMGCSEMFRKNFLQPGSGNLDLFLNSVDAITLNENLAFVRGNKPIMRMIDEAEDSTKMFWMVVVYLLPNALIAAIGIVIAVVRLRSRNAYTMAHVGGN